MDKNTPKSKTKRNLDAKPKTKPHKTKPPNRETREWKVYADTD